MVDYRILYISSQFPNQLNPQTGVFSVERVRALRRAGCQVTVVAPVLMTPHPGLISKPSRFIRWFFERSQLPGRGHLEDIDIRYPKWLCPPKPIFGWYTSIFQYAQIRAAAIQSANELQPQVILASWLPDGLMAGRLGRSLKIPVLCIADGTDVNEWPEKYPGWRFARERLNRQIDLIIYVSGALRDVGMNYGLCPPIDNIIHNAVDVEVFKPGSERPRDDPFTVLAVGRIVTVKGHHILLSAFAEFIQKFSRPARLILIGDGPLKPDLEHQARNLGILPFVQFAGVIDPQHMPTIYRSADLLCLPSFSEGLPCVAVEAMACGIPIVASSVGGVPELVDEHCGLLVPPNDPAALCQALLRAAASPWDSDVIRQKVVDHFSWVQWTEKIVRAVNQVMQNRMETTGLPRKERAWPAW